MSLLSFIRYKKSYTHFILQQDISSHYLLISMTDIHEKINTLRGVGGVPKDDGQTQRVVSASPIQPNSFPIPLPGRNRKYMNTGRQKLKSFTNQNGYSDGKGN